LYSQAAHRNLLSWSFCSHLELWELVRRVYLWKNMIMKSHFWVIVCMYLTVWCVLSTIALSYSCILTFSFNDSFTLQLYTYFGV
jgi:hypothetical protein